MQVFNLLTNRSQRFYRNLFWIWLALILIVSSIPSLPKAEIKIGQNKIRLDHFFHWFQYMTLSFFLISWQYKKHPLQFRKILLFTTILGILVAVADESHQLLIPRRSFTYMDMFSNVLGILTGVFISIWIWKSAVASASIPPDKS